MSEEEYAAYKIAIIGDMSVGKTTLIQRFLKGSADCDATKATVAYDFKVVSIIEDNKLIELHIFDCSGDKQFRELSSGAFKNVKGIIFVYDVSNRESFTNLQDSWLKVAEEFMEEDNQCPIFVVANKMDLAKDQRAVERADGEKFATAQSATTFSETSAVAGLGVEKLFRDIAKTMVCTWGGFHTLMSSEAKQSIKAARKEKKKRFKSVRRVFSCCNACCSGKRKSPKKDTMKSPKACPTPLDTLTHDGKAINEEAVRVDLNGAEASNHSEEEEEEEGQENRPLKNEKGEEVKAQSRESEAPQQSEEEEENQESKPLKHENEEEVEL